MMKSKTGFLFNAIFSFCKSVLQTTTVATQSALVALLFFISSDFSYAQTTETQISSPTINTLNQSQVQSSSPRQTALLYEINSEYVSLQNRSNSQLHHKALLGSRWHLMGESFSQLSVGAKHDQQTTNNATESKSSALFLAKQELVQNHLHFVYERTTENRFGVLLFDYRKLSGFLVSDVYAETFLIPQISDTRLLTTGRASLYWGPQAKTTILDHLSALGEVYHKNSPANWGGEHTDLRLGLRVQPFSFFSFKAYRTVLSTQPERQNEFDLQVNFSTEGKAQ